MKLKSILMTGVLGLAMASMASAVAPTVTLRFTGSTAFRGNTHSAIVHVFDASPAVRAVKSSGSTYTAFRGNINGVDTLITCYWSGSEQAILSLAQQTTANQLSFLSYTAVDTLGAVTDAGLTTAGSVGGSDSSPTALGSPLSTYVTDKTYPDVGMSDTFQASSAYKYKATKYTTLVGAGTDATDGKVGVVPFKWLANKGATITGLTAKQANVLYGNGGYVSQASLTGSSADANKWVYALGRDKMSGTRLTAATEMGLSSTGNLNQYDPFDTNGVLVGAVSTPIVSATAGSTGYTSGGTLCKVLANTAPSNVTFVSYAGEGDADKSGQGIPAGAKELAWNGVMLGSYNTDGSLISYYDGTSADKIANGQYTFWGYEHMYVTSGLSGTAKTIADKVANQIQTVDAPAPLLPNMKVERLTDGAPVTLKAGNDTLRPFN